MEEEKTIGELKKALTRTRNVTVFALVILVIGFVVGYYIGHDVGFEKAARILVN